MALRDDPANPDLLSHAALIVGAALVVTAKLVGEPWASAVVIAALEVGLVVGRQGIIAETDPAPRWRRGLTAAAVTLVLGVGLLVPVLIWASLTGAPPVLPS